MAENKTNIWDLDLEVKALKTVLGESPYASKLYGFLKPEHFHFKVTKLLFARLQEVMLTLDAFPTWRMLVTDSKLESGVQAALQDQFEKSAQASNGGDFSYLCSGLQEFANKRAIYAKIYEGQEGLYDPEKSARDIAGELSSAIIDISDDDADDEMGLGVDYNEFAEQTFQDAINGTTALNVLPSGYSSFDSRNFGFLPGDLVFLGATTGGGKCCDYNSLIPTSAGLLAIGEIHKRFCCGGPGWSVPSQMISVMTRDGLKPVRGLYLGKDITQEVTTNWGDKFRGTAEHKLLCLSDDEIDFKPLADINVGDWIHKSWNNQLFSATEIPVDIAEVLGLYVAEGYSTYRFSNDDASTHDRLQEVSEKYFDHSLTRGSDYTSLRGEFRKFISRHCGELLSADKVVPDIILSSSKISQAAFLRGLFEGDGTVYLKTHGKKAKNEKIWNVELDSLSENLIYQVKAMLENLGILASVRRKRAWATNGSERQVAKINYRLRLNRSTLKEFYRTVGFLSDRKTNEVRLYLDQLELAHKSTNTLACGWENKLPANTVRKYIDRLREICRTTVVAVEQGSRWGGKVSYDKLCGEWHCFTSSQVTVARRLYDGRDYCSRYFVEALLQAHRQTRVHPTVSSVVDSDDVLIFLRVRIEEQLKHVWSRVTGKIFHNEETPVFDLSVQDKKEYSASGFMSHNSTMALNMLTRQYLRGKNTVMASYEMSYGQLHGRHLSLLSEIPHDRIRSNNLTVEERRIVECAWREFNLFGKKNGNRFWISCPTKDQTVMEVGMKYADKKPHIYIFDYINFLKRGSKKKLESQWQELGEISREGKILARRKQCVVVMLMQIDKEHQVRYAKAIQDHADWVWGWVFDEEAKTNGFVNVKQMKARSGNPFDFQLVTRFDICQFRDPEDEDKNLSYTETQLQALNGECRQLGVLPNVEQKQATNEAPTPVEAAFASGSTEENVMTAIKHEIATEVASGRVTPARSYLE